MSLKYISVGLLFACISASCTNPNQLEPSKLVSNFTKETNIHFVKAPQAANPLDGLTQARALPNGQCICILEISKTGTVLSAKHVSGSKLIYRAFQDHFKSAIVKRSNLEEATTWITYIRINFSSGTGAPGSASSKTSYEFLTPRA